MNIKILSICVNLLLLFINFSGCIEEIPSVESKTIYVDDDGGKDYISIQNAIDVANEGDTIYVYNGTYYELLIINKSINLIGASKEKTIINYDKNRYGQINIIVVNANNCTIKGFKLINTFSSSLIMGINVKSSNNIISNNAILNTTEGISIDAKSKNNTIFLNIILNNEFGIALRYSDHNNISKNNISLNTFSGVYLKGALSHNNTISCNTVSNNEYGMYLTGIINNKIFENTVVNNTKQGIYFCCGAQGNIIYYNIFKGNNECNACYDGDNQWDNGSVGNYWDEYGEKYPNAMEIDGIWNTPYNISGGTNQDNYPLVYPAII